MSDKIAVVTGGAKNMGGLISRELAKRGYSIYIHYNSSSTEKDAKKTLEDITSAGGKAWLYQADLTNTANIDKLFADAKSKGKITLAINTVGKVLKKPIEDISEQEYDEMFNINSKVAFFFIQKAAKNIEDGGKIISIVTALLAAFAPGYSTYQGSKSPVDYFTRAAAKELMPRGIAVNNIAPGPVDDPFFYGQETPEAVAFHKSQALGNRLTNVSDVWPVVELLEKSEFISGQTLYVNGAYTSKV